jgi:hypothetical protein
MAATKTNINKLKVLINQIIKEEIEKEFDNKIIGTLYIFDYLQKFYRGANITKKQDDKIRDILKNSGPGPSKETTLIIRIGYIDKKDDTIIKVNENVLDKIINIIGYSNLKNSYEDLRSGELQAKNEGEYK